MIKDNQKEGRLVIKRMVRVLSVLAIIAAVLVLVRNYTSWNGDLEVYVVAGFILACVSICFAFTLINLPPIPVGSTDPDADVTDYASEDYLRHRMGHLDRAEHASSHMEADARFELDHRYRH